MNSMTDVTERNVIAPEQSKQHDDVHAGQYGESEAGARVIAASQGPSDEDTDALLPASLLAFLPCRTPLSWVEAALENPELLLIDHAQCEKKAASTAMSLMYRYVNRPLLLTKMSQLAREELLHFEQVVGLMEKRGIVYRHIKASRYAEALRQQVRDEDPQRLVDILLIGALIEARSCERFARLIPYLEPELAKFYRTLVKSEGRHYEDYLMLAEQYTNEPLEPRLAVLREVERELIETPDAVFRFHSGQPSARRAARASARVARDAMDQGTRD